MNAKTTLSAWFLTVAIAVPAGAADGYRVLHAFSGAVAAPAPGLVRAADGLFYGVTTAGGANGYGTVFRLGADGTAATLHDFDLWEGQYPNAPLLAASDGSLYGTASAGGYGHGTAFRVTPDGAFTTLHRFATDGDGWSPEAGLVEANGALYGTTVSGDPSSCHNGTIFRLGLDGAYERIHVFTLAEGSFPQAALLRGSDGHLYGTSWAGGGTVHGTVYRISLPSGELACLHRFTGRDGSSPLAPLVQGSDGFLYGTTDEGGIRDAGTIFRIDRAGHHTKLHDFAAGPGGSRPRAALTESGGAFFGTTSRGGEWDRGTVFVLDASMRVATIHSFSRSEGGNPSGLWATADGGLVGTTPAGGPGDSGSIFRVSRSDAFQSVLGFDGKAR